ncbi:Antibiotic biosynthesis monooxygenase [Nannocystis exedens]|uniref:Antibiotic biosynthesis monooxygenase n=1 Tax=Nannocystis exedens TaxID=54 RepID=A0A1I2GM04_9BACT|nr:antibiotic biosynthesis monooxygenase [Nannocystis exedens]PCC73613.1 Antibiotic biosynthesis monooxygenase [Nannocystis exedens]SFF17877.1 Antibiotic biosynthesis monooxygenase [Nannocystis exedens]
MKTIDRALICAPRARAIRASRWAFPTPEEREAAIAALASFPARPGLVRLGVFADVEDPSLFVLSQRGDGAGTDDTVAAPPGHCEWQVSASPYRSFVREAAGEASCLVVVRQPLVRPDRSVQRDWVDTVLAALAGEPEPPPGLRAATFFLSEDGGCVLNLAEWTSAEAHRAALQPSGIGQYGSLGDSPAWRAARAHPGIVAEHEVRRYRLVAAVEPATKEVVP